jgi:hypothetical protein
VLVNNPGGEVKFVVEKKEGPQTIKFQWLAQWFPWAAQERLDKRSVPDIISIDMAVTEVADEQDFVIKLTKTLMLRHPR